jgi:DNA-binding MarR family transcriptional regulator
VAIVCGVAETLEERVGAWRGLLQAHAEVLRAIEADLRRTGAVPLAWYDVLLELNAAPDRRLRMTDLASRVVLSRTRVSRIVDDLVRAGLVERSPDPVDKRGAYATLTPEGRKAFKHAAPLYLDAIDRHFTTLLSDQERTTIAAALERVAAHHRQQAQGTPPRAR